MAWNYMFVLILTIYKAWWEGILCYWLLWDIALILFCNYRKIQENMVKFVPLVTLGYSLDFIL